MVAADFDSDGDMDLYVSNFGSSNELLLNCGNGYSMLPESKFCVPSPRLPVLESVTPHVGTTRGGELAVVRGNLGADPSGQLFIGGEKCDMFSYSSTFTWLCNTPAGVFPAGDVIVQNFGRLSRVISNEEPKFEYGKLTINRITPAKFYNT